MLMHFMYTCATNLTHLIAATAAGQLLLTGNVVKNIAIHEQSKYSLNKQ
jgi:hypothetical protein